MNNLIRIDENSISSFISFFPLGILDEFIENEHVELFGIVNGREAVGGIAVRNEFPTVHLLWIYTMEDMVKRGVDTDALLDLFFVLYRQGYGDVRVVIDPETDPGIEQSLRRFKFVYRLLGRGSYISTLGEIRKNKTLKKTSSQVVSLAETTARVFNRIVDRIESSGGNLLGEGLSRRYFNEELSSIYIEGDKATGLLLVKQDDENVYRISFMYSESENILAPVEMIRHTFERADSYGDDTVVKFDLINENLIEFVEKLVGGEVIRSKEGILDLSFLRESVKAGEDALKYFYPVLS